MLSFSTGLRGIALFAALVISAGSAKVVQGTLAGPSSLFFLSSLDSTFQVEVVSPPVEQGFFPHALVSVHSNKTGKLITESLLNTTEDGFSIVLGAMLNQTGFDTIVVSACGVENPNSCVVPLSIPVTVAPGIISILPPILTVVVAIATRQVLISLLLGLWLCGMFLSSYNPFTGLLSTLDFLWVNGLASSSHAAIIIFTFLLGGFLGVLHSAKGGEGLAKLLAGKTSESSRRASISTFILSCVLFFDDYTNIMLAGSTMAEAFAGAACVKDGGKECDDDDSDGGNSGKKAKESDIEGQVALNSQRSNEGIEVRTVGRYSDEDGEKRGMEEEFPTASRKASVSLVVDAMTPERKGSGTRGWIPHNTQNEMERVRDLEKEGYDPAEIQRLAQHAVDAGAFDHLPAPKLGVISREKLGLIVHGVGVCIVSFFPISSWVGVELGYIQAVVSSFPGTMRSSFDPFIIFLRSIPYRIFPLSYIIFLLAVAITRRDFGGIHKKERELYFRRKSAGAHSKATSKFSNLAAVSGKGSVQVEEEEDRTAVKGGLAGKGSSSSNTEPTCERESSNTENKKGDDEKAVPVRWANAVVPLVFVILASLAGMAGTGAISARAELDSEGRMNESVSVVQVFAHCESMNALLWAMFGGTVLLFLLVIPQKIVTLSSAMESWIKGVEEVAFPIVILSLAWALGDAIKSIHTAEYMAAGIKNGMPLAVLPFLAAIASYLMAFATGSAFGTMGILTPLFVPLAFTLSGSGVGPGGVEGSVDSVAGAVGAVFGGAAFGNVYSPIADDTILTALSVGCDVSSHVNSQLPYGIMSGIVTLLATLLVDVVPSYLSFLPFLISSATLIALLFAFGRKPNQKEIKWGGKLLGKRCKCSTNLPPSYDDSQRREKGSKTTCCKQPSRSRNVTGSDLEGEVIPLLR